MRFPWRKTHIADVVPRKEISTLAVSWPSPRLVVEIQARCIRRPRRPLAAGPLTAVLPPGRARGGQGRRPVRRRAARRQHVRFSDRCEEFSRPCRRISTCIGSRSNTAAATDPERGPTPILVRYADDFVVLARYQSRQLVNWIERLLEGRFRLTINREKTRIVKMRQPGESLSFLRFTLRYDRDQFGRDHRYLNVIPSAKALARAREKIRDMTGPQRCCVPIPQLIQESIAG